MSQHVTDSFITPMRFRFPIPSGLDPAAFVADLAESLAGYTEHQLKNAAVWFRDTRKTRTFPTTAECRSACERFTSAPQEAQTRAKPRVWQSDEERRSEAIAAELRRQDAVALVTGSALAEQALADGWLLTLLEFVEDWQRFPEGYEINRCRSKAEALDGAARSVSGSLGASFQNLRATMKVKAIRAVFGPEVADQWEPAIRAELSAADLAAMPSRVAAE